MSRAISVPAEPAHIAHVAEHMRQADRDEVLASDGWTPHEALRESRSASFFTRALLIDGEPVAIFGGVFLGVAVLPWALTTDAVERHPIAFVKASKHVVRELLVTWPHLVQCIDARHVKALRWAKALGFEVEEPHVCGLAGLPFHRIVLRRS